MAGRFYELFHRSIVKAITFRLMILIADGIIIYLITRRYDLTLGVVLFSNISSTIIYIIHERIWNEVHWGKHHK
ncbi:hypothetical protein A3D03_03320 [Candidatus Gottesmanbacteria bacterium RIFCSPHIGHO2_02_FULL_40_13]|uniref:DUF2061 domain-containing protein n=1 Tax=Candidatus Gottesmanbacteria bacterium RIFCSPHIGHO2_02_FULL_40_13 TaxID=1798384 RepID=A0A1F6A6Y8_9BACT|nr:MAG: hypothetical protein A3D03_03320 [Candidatus Gottesmanbacteria bacterium RIFCSPHIGHO2_02_FULL_40_13]